MVGYEVITSDGSKAGRVVGTRGDDLVVEHGTLRKSRHLLPRTFVEVDEDEHVVRASITKDVLQDSPRFAFAYSSPSCPLSAAASRWTQRSHRTPVTWIVSERSIRARIASTPRAPHTAPGGPASGRPRAVARPPARRARASSRRRAP